MVIFIDEEKKAQKNATEFVPKPDDLVRQIVRAWHQSNINHHFKNKKRFRKAIRRNRKTLEAPGTIATLFRPKNYFFSTKAKGRHETLYFKNRTTKQTGRLRQQHLKDGPLAKVDKKPRKHLFLSEKEFRDPKKWHKKNKGCLPDFRPAEERPQIGKHHIEFAYDGTDWHFSEGTVERDKRNLARRIASALENIIGIGGRKSI